MGLMYEVHVLGNAYRVIRLEALLRIGTSPPWFLRVIARHDHDKPPVVRLAKK
jgi:hypothetical protein